MQWRESESSSRRRYLSAVHVPGHTGAGAGAHMTCPPRVLLLGSCDFAANCLEPGLQVLLDRQPVLKESPVVHLGPGFDRDLTPTGKLMPNAFFSAKRLPLVVRDDIEGGCTYNPVGYQESEETTFLTRSLARLGNALVHGQSLT